MKKYLIILLLFPLVTLASESWYRVTTTKGLETYDFFGTVNYKPDDFIKAIQNNSFIQINNLVYFDNQNRVKSWSEWAPYLKSEVYIKSTEIISFIPLSSDPTKK